MTLKIKSERGEKRFSPLAYAGFHASGVLRGADNRLS